MKEVEVRFGRKVKTGDYETATFEITAKINLGDTNNIYAKIPELFKKLENEVEKEIAKFKEAEEQKAQVPPTKLQQKAEKQLSTAPTKEEWMPTKNPKYVMRKLPNGKIEFKDIKTGRTWIKEAKNNN